MDKIDDILNKIHVDILDIFKEFRKTNAPYLVHVKISEYQLNNIILEAKSKIPRKGEQEGDRCKHDKLITYFCWSCEPYKGLIPCKTCGDRGKVVDFTGHCYRQYRVECVNECDYGTKPFDEKCDAKDAWNNLEY